MAIKSSDPHKLVERSYAGVQFDRAVEDAWATRHDDEDAPSHFAGHQTRGRGGMAEIYRNAHSTHHPFSDLRRRLRRH